MSKLKRTLKNKVNQGNLIALYELHQNLILDLDSEANKIQATSLYYQGVANLSFSMDKDGIERPINPFRLEKLQLRSYKQFDSLELNLEPFITVVIGDNGAGKSSILEAIAKMFSIINNRIVGKGRTGKKIEFWEIKIGSLEPAEVSATFKLGDKTYYNGNLVLSPKGVSSSKSTALTDFTSFSNMVRDFNTSLVKDGESELNIPLLAFYSVERSSVKAKHDFNFDLSSESSLESRFDAIDKSALDGTGNLNEFLDWFVKLDNLANTISSGEVLELQKQINALEETVSSESHTLFPILEGLKTQLFRTTSSKVKEIASSQKYKDYLNIIKLAITGVFSDFDDLWVDRSSGSAEVKIDIGGNKINIFQSSKGQQILFSLVADIARRLILLNPSLKNPLSGQGVLLIDEVELHLHPSWQQEIIPNLHKTFPNLQFILTTHSPQVLTTVHNKNIRALGFNTKNERIAAVPLSESYARTNADALYSVMHVDPTPKFSESNLLEEYETLVEQGDLDDNQLTKLEDLLSKKIGSNHPELIRLQMVKKRRKILGS